MFLTDRKGGPFGPPFLNYSYLRSTRYMAAAATISMDTVGTRQTTIGDHVLRTPR